MTEIVVLNPHFKAFQSEMPQLGPALASTAGTIQDLRFHG
jgi:hypothetical protein